MGVNSGELKATQDLTRLFVALKRVTPGRCRLTPATSFRVEAKGLLRDARAGQVLDRAQG
eukprot:9060915-Lingulodinium_polyedra.AAC.1